ncbi:aggrecan core protein isoform X2, partial [Silurus meridionalis]
HCLKLGGHLVSIHNRNEQELVRALIRAHDYSENLSWIGLSNCEKKRSFFWSDGTKYDYAPWAPNEPNFQWDECCVHMNYGDRKGWNDYPCDRIQPFVCAKSSA